MFKKDIINELKNRNLIVQLSNERKLAEILLNKRINLYCGFDPTSDSLHIGHLLILVILRYFQKVGHKPVILIGGATALIGDPSFRYINRKLINDEIVENWSCKIKKQISFFLDFDCGENSAKIVNNYSWFKNINFLSFLRKIGKYFSVNQMINKEAVKKRFEKGANGISYSELSYNLLQSYDFLELNKKYNVELQIGGSDQWGNIVSGIDLTRRIYKKEVFGLTIPLITDSNGTKISKSGQKTIWLDPKKTSPYKFYQFWINISDSDTIQFLKFFSFFSIEHINFLKEKNKNNFQIPEFKYILADKMTELVHGKKNLYITKRITKSLFSNKFTNLKIEDFNYLLKGGIPSVELKIGSNLQNALIKSKLAFSKNQSRSMIRSFAIKINNKVCIDQDYFFLPEDRLFNKYSFIQRGKKNYCLIIWK